MGLPIEKLVIATNQNDILDRVVKSGVYKIERVKPSISPSMDIQVSSNFERALFDIFSQDSLRIRTLMDELRISEKFKLTSEEVEKLQAVFESGSSSEEETNDTISSIFEETGTLMCPHSATGTKVAKEKNDDGDVPMIVLATASPAKFPNAVKAASGISPKLPAHMSDLFDRGERVKMVPNDIKRIKEIIIESINS